MDLSIIINQVISLFMVMLVGFYGRKRNIINEALTKGLTNLLLDICIPLLIICSFNITFNSSMLNNLIKSFIYGLAIFIVTPVFARILVSKTEDRKKNILEFAIVFSNCGFMGFPLIDSVFGQEGIIYAAIFNMFFNIFAWTYGIMLFTEVRSLKGVTKGLVNPGIISVFIGLLVMVSPIKIPVVLSNTMKMVGGMATPISMLIIGSLLATANFKRALKDMSIYYGVFIKLLVVPITLYFVSALFNERSIVMKTFILMQAMPTGATISIFAENYNKEREYSALMVSFSTLFSVITIPLIIRLFL